LDSRYDIDRNRRLDEKELEYFLDFMMPNIQEKVPEILED